LFESAARLARIINIFLNVSSIDSGRFKLDKTMVNINDLVESVNKELQVQAKGKNIGLIFKPDKLLPLMYLDSDKIREVILNLVDNAIKYTPKGSITIETYQEGKEFHFKSMDTGIGIRPEDAKSLFRKFVRGTGIAQINTQGSGLGLYIAQRVVTEHGGRIWVESPGLDKGSAFHFVLPIMQAPEVKPVAKVQGKK
ncbi:HAMP domain-containing histidine kinase, partial [Candidatus Gottesmanbacteria bacterium]|nr:HAMP domain-containing histidine kinase [Candidatus Gottesmanbacteria bacterium]